MDASPLDSVQAIGVVRGRSALLFVGDARAGSPIDLNASIVMASLLVAGDSISLRLPLFTQVVLDDDDDDDDVDVDVDDDDVAVLLRLHHHHDDSAWNDPDSKLTRLCNLRQPRPDNPDAEPTLSVRVTSQVSPHAS
eukprot:3609772-Rhodomonas_salina.2